MTDYDPKRARAKRPIPFWMDAFLRDTQELSTDEIGAYFLIIGAMWRHPTVSVDANPDRLRLIARVSKALWRNRIGPALMPFFLPCGEDRITSKKLLEQAEFVEESLIKQSDRGRGSAAKTKHQSEVALNDLSVTSANDLKSNGKMIDDNLIDKSLFSNNQGQAVVIATDATTVIAVDPTYPTTQLPNPLIDDGEGEIGGKTWRENLLDAMGCDRSGMTGHGGRMIGKEVDMIIARKWQEDLGLTEDQILGQIRDVMANKREPGPPSSFKFFSKAMERLAGDLQDAINQPLQPTKGNPNGKLARKAQSEAAERQTIDRIGSGEIKLGTSYIDPFK